MLRDLALLSLRTTIGGYVAGHGAQKLFGSFGGPGLDAAAEHFEHMHLTPGRQMAAAAGALETVGGTLTALGLANPIGPICVGSAMAVAAGTAHRGKPPFAQQGGPELPLTNLAGALALAAVGPGRLSLDRLLHARVPRVVAVAAYAAAAAGVVIVVKQHIAQTQQAQASEPAPAVEEATATNEVDLRTTASASAAGAATATIASGG